MRDSDSVYQQLADHVAELIALIPRLEEEIPEKRRNPYGGFGSGKGGHGQLAAWNTQAAYLLLDVHIGARELELNIRYQVSGSIWIRGGSTGNTISCLRNLPSLAAGVPHDVAAGAVRKTGSWVFRGQLVLGQVEPLSRLPRLPGEAEPCCPFGNHKGTLRVRHASGVVACIHPACRDANNQRPVGRIELGAYSGEPVIAWADGTTGVAA